ncbi:hypothetical protein OIO90_004784 [Microbotryomycetes sp. JL221]|nr:hypothetical protein OIO90_004784 [Microbotryomycetes sp. JL221]
MSAVRQAYTRLPHLTLFTGGAECSLCEVAKQDLAIVQRLAPFDLSLYNIRRQAGDDPDEWNRTLWRRLYQYDIPVLHFGRPEDFETLAGRGAQHGKLMGGRIMKHRIDKDRLVELVHKWTRDLNNEDPVFTLYSNEAGSTETFYVDSEPFNVETDCVPRAQHSYDYHCFGGDVLAEVAILGDNSAEGGARQSEISNKISCFNCGGDHTLSKCPFRRDARTIAANRAAFNEDRAFTSDRARVGVAENSAKDNARFFIRTYRPGFVSKELAHALDITPHGELAFLYKIWEWGYPPGWHCAKDPLETVQDRVGRDLDLASIPMLRVYGFDEDGQVQSREALRPIVTSGHDLEQAKSTNSGIPALPDEPPPPMPEEIPPLQRWARYNTTLFDWTTLPLHRADVRFPLEQRKRSGHDESIHAMTRTDDEGEADMDMSDSE